MTDLTKIDPDTLAKSEADAIKAVLDKLPGLKRLISVVESRAKELLAEDPQAFGGEWVLKEGAKDRRIVDQERFVEKMLQIQDAKDEYAFSPQDLLQVSTFAVGKVEKLIQEKLGLPKRLAAEKVDSLGNDIIKIGKKAPTLKQEKR